MPIYRDAAFGKEENNKIKIGKQKYMDFEQGDDKILNIIIIVHNLDTSYVKVKTLFGKRTRNRSVTIN